MKKLRMFTLLIAVCCWLGRGLAQDTGWSGHVPSEVADKSGDNGTVYLYNVKYKTFVNMGGSWGTQPQLHTVGLPLGLEQGTANDGSTEGQDCYYKINSNTSYGSVGNTYIGYVRQGDTDNKSDGNYNELYVDREGSSSKSYDGIVRMLFENISGNIYNIGFWNSDLKHDANGDFTSSTSVAKNRTLGSTYNISYSINNTTYYVAVNNNTAGTSLSSSSSPTDENAQWVLIDNGDNTVTLVNRYSKLALNMNGDNSSSASPLQWTFDINVEDINQNFTRETNNSGFRLKVNNYYLVGNRNSSLTRTTNTRNATTFYFTEIENGATEDELGITRQDDNQEKTKYYWEVQSDERTIKAVKTVTDAEAAQWIIVTLKDLKDAFENVEATYAVPADATFYISDQNFHRNNQAVNKWETSDGTLVNGNNNSTNTKYFAGLSQADGDQQPTGQYWAANMQNISGTGQISQTITVPKKGYYIVSCKGLYVPASNSSVKAELFAVPANEKAAQSVALVQHDGIFAEKDVNKYINGGKVLKKESGYDAVLLVYVDEAETSLELGVKVTDAGMDDWVCFDDVQLRYCGDPTPDFIMLEEYKDNMYIAGGVGTKGADYINNQADENGSHMFRLQRTLKANQWGSLILPVNLTAIQVKTAFGGAVKLSKMNGFVDSPSIIRFESVDLSHDNEIALEANTLYIIKPTQEFNREETYNRGDRNITGGKEDKLYGLQVEGGHYLIPQVTMEKSVVPESGVVSEISEKEYGTLTFHGTYLPQSEKIVPEGAYVLGAQDGNWYHLTNPMSIKGFRTWITLGDDTNVSALKYSIDGKVQGEVTAIDNLEVVNTISKDSKVYSINGQIVGKDASVLNTLPKGIYIVNNRKYIIK